MKWLKVLAVSLSLVFAACAQGLDDKTLAYQIGSRYHIAQGLALRAVKSDDVPDDVKDRIKVLEKVSTIAIVEYLDAVANDDPQLGVYLQAANAAVSKLAAYLAEKGVK